MSNIKTKLHIKNSLTILIASYYFVLGTGCEFIYIFLKFYIGRVYYNLIKLMDKNKSALFL